MKLDRRAFLQGLVTAAVAAAIPRGSATPPAATPGNRLLPPDEVAGKALRILKKHIRFTQDYDIERDALILRADYRPSQTQHWTAAVHLDDVKDEEISAIEDMLHHSIEERLAA